VRFEGAVQLDSVALTPSLISPDGDGALESALATFTLATPASITGTVVQGGMSLGVAFQASYPVGTHSVPWQGTAGGQPLPDGTYRLRLEAQGLCGTVSAEAPTPIALDVTPPVARMDTPLDGAQVRASVAVLGEASDVHFQEYELGLGAGLLPTNYAPVPQVGNR